MIETKYPWENLLRNQMYAILIMKKKIVFYEKLKPAMQNTKTRETC